MKKKLEVNSIADLFVIIHDELENFVESISTLLNDSSKVKVGYHIANHFRYCDRLTKQTNAANICSAAFAEIVALEKNLNTWHLFFTELSQAKDIDALTFELRKKYLHRMNVPASLPGFKETFLVASYDFPPAIETAIQNIVDNCGAVNLTDADLTAYWNPSSLAFELTDEHKESLKERFALYIGTDEISEMISMKLLVTGLTNLRKEPYTFRSLPEIDYRLLGLMKQNTRGLEEVDVDVKAFEDKYNAGHSTRLIIANITVPDVIPDKNESKIALDKND